MVFAAIVMGALSAGPLLSGSGGLAVLDAAPTPSDEYATIARPFFDAHCVRCHGADDARADLRLDRANSTAGDDVDWEWLLELVDNHDMPPPGEEAPSDAERETFVAWLTADLRQGASAPTALPRSPLRRLTRAEYRGAARDLFGMDLDVSRFLPEDVVGHGFDHVASSQSLGEADFVRYLEAAEALAGMAIPTRTTGPPRVRRVPPSEIRSSGGGDRVARQSHSGDAAAAVFLPGGAEYIVRARVYGEQAGPDPCRVKLFAQGAKRSEALDVTETEDEPRTIEARFAVPRGGRVSVGVEFLNDYYDSSAEDPGDRDRNLVVEWIEIEGPFGEIVPSPFAESLLARVDDAGGGRRGLRKVCADLAAIVWRTDEVRGKDVKRLLQLSNASDEPLVRLRVALTGMLASPRFLFREEAGEGRVDERDSQALRSIDVATRLAGFLWSSVPDENLFRRAAKSNLSEPAQAAECAAAMLDDPRSDAFIDGFAEQWLQLRGLSDRWVKRSEFPDFDGVLRRAMREETKRVLRDSFRNERSLWDLVDGEMTIVNERLAEHYGIDWPDGESWQRLSLADTPRRGLVGHASVLFLTSDATRTSPVKRGKWVLDVLLGSAPPPPPPGVDSIDDEEQRSGGLTLRETMEAHRADPACASCHSRMDPIGFGLEGFDAIGAFSPPEGADLSGELPDGTRFDGSIELAAVLREDDRFLRATVERLLVYALGRGLERADRGTVDAVLAELDPESPTLRQAILGVVKSDAFLRIAK